MFSGSLNRQIAFLHIVPSQVEEKNLGVSLNAKFSSVRDFMAIIKPPPQAYNSGGSLVRLHKHGCHNKARLI